MGLLPLDWIKLRPFNTTHFVRVRYPPFWVIRRRIEGAQDSRIKTLPTPSIAPYAEFKLFIIAKFCVMLVLAVT